MNYLITNIRFYIYTKLLDYYLIKGNYVKVEFYLNLKKELAKILRDKLGNIKN